MFNKKYDNNYNIKIATVLHLINNVKRLAFEAAQIS